MATTTRRSTVVGVFSDRSQAQRAVEDLKRAGFTDKQIGVVTQKGDENEPSLDRATGSKLAEGSAIGAAAGAGVGALWALGIAASVFPPLGVVVGGPLIAFLASAGSGAVVGTILGGLTGLGIPEDEAKYYEGEIKAGRTLVTVHDADGRYDEAWAILRRYGAYDMNTRDMATAGTATGTSHATGARATGSQTVRLHEEQLHATKQPVQTGEVRVRKEVVTEQKTLNVPVEREEVVIERHPASGKASSADIRAGEEIRIPVKEERVRVEKTPVVTEEVSVGKRKVQDSERVSGTVRKEQVKVEETGDVEVRGKTTK